MRVGVMSDRSRPTGGALSPAGLVLAAGEGRRLRPLTRLRPKPLCTVAGVPLVDLALARLDPVTGERAVNLHHGRVALEDHLDRRWGATVHRSVEVTEALGTAGAVGAVRGWVEGRPLVVVNGDTWCPAPLDPLVEGWDGERVRLLVVGPAELGPRSAVVASLLPWSQVAALAPEPSGLYERCWVRARAEGRLEVVAVDAPFFDCGTPDRYLAANLAASGGVSVVEPGAVVEGRIEQSVVWAGSRVDVTEELRHAIRAEGITVLVRSRRPDGGSPRPSG